MKKKRNFFLKIRGAIISAFVSVCLILLIIYLSNLPFFEDKTSILVNLFMVIFSLEFCHVVLVLGLLLNDRIEKYSAKKKEKQEKKIHLWILKEPRYACYDFQKFIGVDRNKEFKEGDKTPDKKIQDIKNIIKDKVPTTEEQKNWLAYIKMSKSKKFFDYIISIVLSFSSLIAIIEILPRFYIFAKNVVAESKWDTLGGVIYFVFLALVLALAFSLCFVDELRRDKLRNVYTILLEQIIKENDSDKDL